MANQFVKTDYDKFTSTSTTQMTESYEMKTAKKCKIESDHGELYSKFYKVDYEEVVMYLNFKYVKGSSSTKLLMELEYGGKTEYGLKDGCLIVNINDSENIELFPKENYTRQDEAESLKSIAIKNMQGALQQITGNNAQEAQGTSVKSPYYRPFIHESVYYEISKDLLKKICDSKSLDFKIVGKNRSCENNANNFSVYAQQFYNGVYDSQSYSEILSADSIKDDSSSGGCIVTLLMMLTTLSSLFVGLTLLFGFF